MNIIVEGIGSKSFKPDQISLDFDFKTREDTYDLALEKGVKSVEKYINLLTEMGFSKEQLKTRSFRVSEERYYNEDKRKYESDGYAYYQNARLEFDYDMERLSALMEVTSQQLNPPIYRIYFNIKDTKKSHEEVLTLAYNDALLNANIIAKASGTKVVGCKKTSFQPFDGENGYNSTTMYDASVMTKSKYCSESTRESIQNIIIPEDVTVQTNIYCEFIAE